MAAEQEKRLAVDWRHVVIEGIYRSGLLRACHGLSRRYEWVDKNGRGGRFRNVREARYVILGYHRVGTEGAPLFSRLPGPVFARQMQYIRRHYRILSVRQMVEELRNPGDQGRAVVVTFDDGYLGTYTEAFPVLQDYQIPATVYLAAGAIENGDVPWYDRIFLQFRRAGSTLKLLLDRPRSFELRSDAARIEAATEIVMYLRSIPDEQRQDWCRRFDRMVPLAAGDLHGAMMSWEQVLRMRQSGVTFGAHTMTHPVASRLGPEELRKEVAESKRLIEQRLSSGVDEFAFPFGKPRDCGNAAATLLAELGFRTALTTIVGVNRPGADLFRLRRLVIGDDPSISMFAFKLHQLFFHPVDEELSLPIPTADRSSIEGAS